MKSKQIAALLLIAALTAGTLSCKGTSDDNIENDTLNDSTSDLSDSTVSSEYQVPNVDYGGAEFPIVVYNNTSSNFSIVKYNMTIEEENGDIINDAIAKVNRSVEESLNVDIQMSPLVYNYGSNISALTTSILSGDDEFKFAMIMSCAMQTLLSQPDMLVDLAKINTLDLTHSWWDENSIDEYNIYGKQYSAVGDICINMKGAPVCVFFNKKIIDDMQLDDPYELVDSGRWTIDNMEKMAAAAQRDLNGDTKVDIGDQFGLAAEPASLSYFLYAGGIRYSTRERDSINITINDPKTVAVIEKIVPLLNNQEVTMLSTRWQNGYKSVFTELMLPTFTDDRVLFFSNQLLVALNLRDMNADFGVLPMPKLDEEQERYYSAASTWWSDNVIVPATNRELEMTGNVIDAMGYYSQQYVTPAFIDHTVIGKTLRDEDSERMINLIFDTQVYDIAQIFNWGNIIDKISAMPGGNNTNFASLYGSAEASVLSDLDKTIEYFQ